MVERIIEFSAKNKYIVIIFVAAAIVGARNADHLSETLAALNESLLTWPEGFAVHPKLQRQLDRVAAEGLPQRWARHLAMRDATLGLAFTRTGWLYPFFAAMLGWLGVALTGNEIGLDEAGVKALPAVELSTRLERAYARLRQAGAHYVVDGIWDVPPVLGEINARLRDGERI